MHSTRITLLGVILLTACGGPNLPSEAIGRWRHVRTMYQDNASVSIPAHQQSIREFKADGSYWWSVRNPADSLQTDTLRGRWEVEANSLVLTPDNSGTKRKFMLIGLDGNELAYQDNESDVADYWVRVE